jgi:enediyne biosynthesis protein E4
VGLERFRKYCESWILLILPLLLAGAAAQSPPPSAPSAATYASVKFVDVTAASGVKFQNKASHTSKKYLPETMGAGVALFDYDNDGRLDIFFVNGAPLSDPTAKGTIPQKTGPEYWNRLYHQKKDGTFEDVTEHGGLQGAGYGMGVAVGDYDNDGYEDLYVTAYGGNKLYHNRGDGTFADVTEKAGVGGSGWSTSAAWVDLDGDGLLDLVVLRYLLWDFDDIWCGEHRENYRAYCHPDMFPAITPLVFHNDGGGHFTEVSAKVGLNRPGKGLGIALGDYDRDGRTDIFVANDSMFEFLYHNKGDGTYEENGLLAATAVDGDGRTYAGMGVEFQDYDNDGLPDLFVTDLANQKYALYKNNGDGSFTYVTDTSGVAGATMLHSGWGVRLFDDNNDGLKDLIIAQGHDIDNIQLTYPQLRYREPLKLLQNTGHGAFLDISEQAGDVFKQAWVGRGLAVGDLDNDGREDVVVTTNDGPAYVLHNETSTANHWLTLDLVGHQSNRDAIGAEVKVTTHGGSQWLTISPAGSYLSSSDKRAHFGLGAATEATVQIHWPSGVDQVLKNVKANQVMKIDEPGGPAKRGSAN